MQDTTPTPSTQTRLIPVDDWPKFHPWPATSAGLRHLIYHRAENGADEWIVRVGRRVLVDEAAFIAWARRGVATPGEPTADGNRRRVQPARRAGASR